MDWPGIPRKAEISNFSIFQFSCFLYQSGAIRASPCPLFYPKNLFLGKLYAFFHLEPIFYLFRMIMIIASEEYSRGRESAKEDLLEVIEVILFQKNQFFNFFEGGRTGRSHPQVAGGITPQ